MRPCAGGIRHDAAKGAVSGILQLAAASARRSVPGPRQLDLPALHFLGYCRPVHRTNLSPWTQRIWAPESGGFCWGRLRRAMSLEPARVGAFAATGESGRFLSPFPPSSWITVWLFEWGIHYPPSKLRPAAGMVLSLTFLGKEISSSPGLFRQRPRPAFWDRAEESKRLCAWNWAEQMENHHKSIRRQ